MRRFAGSQAASGRSVIGRWIARSSMLDRLSIGSVRRQRRSVASVGSAMARIRLQAIGPRRSRGSETMGWLGPLSR
jgi:hypothetical protein